MKKIYNSGTLIIAVLILSVATSCHKYEEGPGVSFRSKKSRVANRWSIVARTVNFRPDYLNADDVDDVYEFSKGGSYIYTNPRKYSIVGSWEFINDKEYLRIYVPASNWTTDIIDYKIIRLAEKELWLREYKSNGDIVETHFIPAY